MPEGYAEGFGAVNEIVDVTGLNVYHTLFRNRRHWMCAIWAINWEIVGYQEVSF